MPHNEAVQGFGKPQPRLAMRAYIATTGVLFLALVVAHVLRIVAEPHLARDPWFLLTTVISVAMTGWALQLFRRAAGSGNPAA
jgi:hypothetical protein